MTAMLWEARAARSLANKSVAAAARAGLTTARRPGPGPRADAEGACVVDVVRTQFTGVSQLTILGPARPPPWLGEVIPAVGAPVVLLRRPRSPARSGGNQTGSGAAPPASQRVRTHNAYSDAVLILTKGTMGSAVDRSLGALPRLPRQRVVVWLPHALRDSKDLRALLTAVVQAAWRRRLLRLLVVVSEEGTGPVATSKCAVYTLRPYPSVCRRKTATLPLECSWTASMTSPAPECLGSRSVFTEPRLLDLRGCRLQVAISIEGPFAMFSKRRGAQGLTGELLNAWARYGNFSVSVTDKASRVTRYQSGIAGGALGIVGDIVVGRKDLAIGAFLLTPDRHEAVAHAQSYSNIHYEYAVPTGLAPVSSLLNLFNELDADLWVLVNLAVVVVAAATRALWRRRSSRREEPEGDQEVRGDQGDDAVPSLVAALAILAAVMVDVPVPARWRNEQGSPLRVVLTSWILFCLVLRTAYEIRSSSFTEVGQTHPWTVRI
ncbi:Glutamate receptor ionotropic, delta-1 [Frankliniella fusca]|uniref:Glutamate receptor ionotropic, delta-1 n=1 Tax=Frankliniella fusca TaxID=407009 RepID=A0AAE1LU63_9NEOP|nr:Glutamate receptor ionotropic, delta-1 [Frankliniella fusca]